MSSSEPAGEGPLHAAIYARVSTDDQLKGFSIETQVGACQAYANDHQMIVWQSHVFVDRGITGTILERPALTAMREVIRTGAVRAVIVYDLDRLSRVLWHQCMLIEGWQKDGVPFHTVGQKIEDTPEGRMLRHVMGSFAEMEHAKIRERSLRGQRKRIASGFPHATTAPYGFRWKKLEKASTLEIDDTEAEVVRQIFRWTIQGLPMMTIARKLTQQRVLTRWGTQGKQKPVASPWTWGTSRIRSMLNFAGYLGRLYAGQERRINGKRVKQPRELWIEIHVPPIIDQETFDAAKAQLTKNRIRSRRNRKHDYLLSPYNFRCGVCGAGMTACMAQHQNIPPTSWYKCSRRSRWGSEVTHGKSQVHGKLVEPRVWEFVEHLLDDPKSIQEAIVLAQAGGAEQRMEAQRCLDRFEQEIFRKDREDLRLVEAYQGGAMTVEELKLHRQQLATDKHALIDERWKAQEALDGLGALPPEPYELDAYVACVRKKLKTGSIAEKRMVIEDLGLIFIWTPGQRILVIGEVPSHTLGQRCTWQDELGDWQSPRAVVLERIQAMFAQGMTFRRIIDILNADGTPTLKGYGRWSHGSLHHLRYNVLAADQPQHPGGDQIDLL